MTLGRSYQRLWSDVLDADAVEWFEENGGLSRANGERLRKYVLSVRGRDGTIEALLRRHGLA